MFARSYTYCQMMRAPSRWPGVVFATFRGACPGVLFDFLEKNWTFKAFYDIARTEMTEEEMAGKTPWTL
jgi:hypothetical protein